MTEQTEPGGAAGEVDVPGRAIGQPGEAGRPEGAGQPGGAGRPEEAGRRGPVKRVELLLVTGMSGAGKTAAAAELSDLGWFVVDNLPASLLLELVETVTERTDRRRIAMVVDVRGGVLFAELQGVLKTLTKHYGRPHVLFLEANDESLVRRFDSVRRPHPLQGERRIVDGIDEERAMLADLRANADLVIDTSLLNVNQLGARIRAAFAREQIRLRAIVVSFGFKYGLPVDADFVADMRFLPNPHWVPELKPLTGCDAPVSDYVLAQSGAEDFLDHYAALIHLVREGYLREGKQFVTVGVGCTGGKHRSVAMAEALAKRLRSDDIETLVVHRDLGRE